MNKRIVALILLLTGSVRAFTEETLLKVKYQTFDTAIVIDSGFKRYTDFMNELAIRYTLEIKVQDSFRIAGEEVTSAIVVPIKTSNHLVGHAIDVNLLYGGKLYTSKYLNKFSSLPEPIKAFILGCTRAGIRWGGYFTTVDGVHFDDNLYESDKSTYEKLYKRYQNSR